MISWNYFNSWDPLEGVFFWFWRTFRSNFCVFIFCFASYLTTENFSFYLLAINHTAILTLKSVQILLHFPKKPSHSFFLISFGLTHLYKFEPNNLEQPKSTKVRLKFVRIKISQCGID